MKSKHSPVYTLIVIFFIACAPLHVLEASSGRLKKEPENLINKPQQITTEIEPVSYFDICEFTRKIAFTSSRDGFTDIWISGYDPGRIDLPEKLTDDSSPESFPAFSPDGKRLVYAGASHDVKGDIYLLNLDGKGSPPVRLTGRKTGDGAPCFSPDGGRIYFHQAEPGDLKRRIVYIDLDDGVSGTQVLGTIIDGAFPAISSDGDRIAFVSYESDPAGDISIYSISDRTVTPVTSGPYPDFCPAWSPGDEYVYFTRRPLDTNRDGKIDMKDRAVVYRADVQAMAKDDPLPYLSVHPVTSFEHRSFSPKAAKNGIFFLSDRGGGVSNCWTLPVEGVVKKRETAEMQVASAIEISGRIPYNPYLAIPAYHKVIDEFPEETAACARAAYEIGRIFDHRLNMPDPADDAYRFILDLSSTRRTIDLAPWNDYARIEQIVIMTRRRLQDAQGDSKRSEILNLGVSQLDSIAKYSRTREIRSRAMIEEAQLRIEQGGSASDLSKSLDLLTRVVEENRNVDRAATSEALFLEAELFLKTGRIEAGVDSLRNLAENYSDVPEWADRAVEKIIETAISDLAAAKFNDKIELLRSIEAANRNRIPILAAGALNRIGDLYYAQGDPARAKETYRQTLALYSNAPTQSAAARLSLAEILFNEERFRKALDLYEIEIESRPYQDNIYFLARNGYIRKSIAAGEFLYRIGEVLPAKKTFKELIDYDRTIVEAHRGYIKCTAAVKQIPPLLNAYRRKMEASPGEAVPVYCVALCLTYLEDEKSILEAKDLLVKACSLDARIEYFHQTLGYVFEVMETVYKTGDTLQNALEEYKKAYFLNDPEENPDNAAHLTLNLANTYFLLERYGKAFEQYGKRLETEVPFDNPNTEILFYQRLGASAFQAGETRKSIDAYESAVERIDDSMNPRKGADGMDRIARFMMDRIISPGLEVPKIESEARRLLNRQSDINRKASELNQSVVFPPPADEWDAYKAGMKALLDEQETLYPDAVKLVKTLDPINLAAAEARENLAHLTAGVQQALEFPGRLITLKTELHDRIALARQETGLWTEAARGFKTVYDLNKGLGNHQNLVRNKRSIAYNHYMAAGALTGERKNEMLKTAAGEFDEVLTLIEQYGVADPEARKSKSDGGLFSLDISQAMDKSTATEFAHGFTREQEIRIAEAFLSRIHTELGDLGVAEQAIDAQLAEYPMNRQIREKDLYGVSLVYHRAAHLKTALGKLDEAFDYYLRSGELALQMKNTISTAVNTADAAAVLFLMEQSGQSKDTESRRRRLAMLDRKTGALISETPFIGIRSVAAAYHNRMGVYTFPDPSTPAGVDAKTAAERMKRLETAASHFLRGIERLEPITDVRDRKTFQLLASLYLNMSEVSKKTGSPEAANRYLESALAASEQALLPSIRWRALAGLKRFDEAHAALGRISIIEAGCAPGEITLAFAPHVESMIQAGRVEDAFDLAEQLSEFERYNRLAPLFGNLRDEAKSLFKSLAPRFMTIFKLRESLDDASEKQQRRIRERLRVETEILESEIGEVWRALPEFHRYAADKSARERILALLGISAQLEEISDDYCKSPSEQLEEKYDDFVRRYRKVIETALSERSSDSPSDVIAFFGPEPCTTADVMDLLGAGETLIRIYETGGGEGIVFKVTSDSISAETTDSVETLDFSDSGAYIACDDPDRLFDLNAEFGALSGAHLLRSIKSRKPFKTAVLTAPPLENIPEPFERIDQDSNKESRMRTDMHTLILSGRISLTSTVPTREGETPEPYIVVDTGSGDTVKLSDALMNPTTLSLTLLSGISSGDAYAAGHMASIYNCPTLIFPRTASPGSSFAGRFLKAYSDKAAFQAEQKAEAEGLSQGIEEEWMVLGFKGMTPEQSAEFAEKRFASYVKAARSSFESGEFGRALDLFKNAIRITDITEKFEKYTPLLHKYARESAYRDGNLDTALFHAESLVEYFENMKPESPDHAEALLMLGVLQAGKERNESAIQNLEASAGMTADLEDEPGQLKALVNLGIILENATEYDRALVRFQTAASISESLAKETVLAEQYENIGRIYDLRLNQFARAIQYYADALEIYRAMEDSEGVSRSLLNIGRCRRLLGDFDNAEKAYAEAMQQAENRASKMKIIIEQANNAWFQARYEEAFRLQRECHRIASDIGDSLYQVISLNTAGLIQWTLGDYLKALDHLENALKLAETLNVRDDEVATTLNNIGLVYRDMGKYEKALETLNKALAIDKRLGSKWAVAYDLRNKGLTYLKMDRPADAEPLFEQAVAESGTIGNRINEAKALLGLGKARAALNRPGAAKDAYNEAMALSKSMSDRETLWRSMYGIARIDMAENDMDGAERLLRDAIDVIEEMRAEIKIEGLKDSFIENKLIVYETLVKLLADKGKEVEAFEIAERSRGRNFIDLIGNQRIFFGRDIDQELYDRMEELKTRISVQENLVAQSVSENERSAYQALLDRLNSEYRDLMLEIQVRNPQLSSLVSVNPLKTSDLQALIEPGVMLLAYYLLEREIFVWSVTGESIKLFRTSLGRSELKDTVLEYRRIIQNLEPSETYSQRLYEHLVAPVESELAGVEYLGVLPHGCLHYLSFSSLADEEGEYLIERFPLFYLPNAALYKYTTKKRVREKDLRVLAIGNPDLGNQALDLPFAEHEVASVKWNFDDITILTGAKARESWVVDHVHDYGIIYLASHGEFDPVNPLFSAIKMTKDGDADGNLEAAEVFGLRIDADLVVLSACRTGLGKVTSGDEVIGLNRAFFYAGAHAVMSTLWRVSDVSTAILIKQFFRSYLSFNKAESLRLATLHVKERYPHPAYWAGFTLVGDYF